MASVSSLDKDLRNIRLGKYTPQAANEVRVWIEESIGERLDAGDLLNALKDGIALCKYGKTSPSVVFNLVYGMIDCVQTCQPSNRSTRCSLQAILYALRSNGEHLPLPASLQIAASESPSPRYLPDSRPVRE